MKNCRQKSSYLISIRTIHFLLFLMVANQTFAVPDSTKKYLIHFSNPLKYLKNPFNKNTVKYIDTISAKSTSFHLNEENTKVRKVTTYPVPVGYNDFEENLRDMQLLGKISTENSFTNRPYYLNTQLTYDSLLKLIDTSLKYGGFLAKKKSFEVRLTPFNILQKYTSDHPYGYNDGPLNYSKGYQFLLSGGIAMRWKFISLQLRPEFYKTASDNYETGNGWGAVTKSVTEVIPGQSSLNINLGPITVSAASHNLWSGPGVSNSLLLSNNAQGFKHLSIKSNKPLKTPIGNFEINLISGILERRNNQLNEVFFKKNTYPKFYPRPDVYRSDIPMPFNRYFNFLKINFNPKILPELNIGFQRVFQNYSPANSFSRLTFQNEYLPVFNGIFRTVYVDDDYPRDQKITFYTKLLLPENNMQVYFEFGYNDGVVNFRDLLLRSQRSSAYIFGFNKYFPIDKNLYYSINFESTRIAELPNYLVSYASTFYEHGRVLEGYTNNEQLLGPGVGNGNNAQQISFYIHKDINKFGFKFEHIAQGPINYVDNYFTLGIRSNLWDDYLFGFEGNCKILNNLILKSQINFINSRNYLWIKDNNHSNLFLLMNLIYLW